MKNLKIHDESIMWSAALRQKKIYGFDVDVWLNEAIDQLAMVNSVC